MSTLNYIKTIRDMLGDNGFITLENGTYRDAFNLRYKVLVGVTSDPSGKEQVTLRAVRDGDLSDVIANHDLGLNSVPESVIEFLGKYHEQTRSPKSDPIFHYA